MVTHMWHASAEKGWGKYEKGGWARQKHGTVVPGRQQVWG